MKIAVIGQSVETAKARANQLWPALKWNEKTVGTTGKLSVRLFDWSSSLTSYRFDQIVLMNYADEPTERIEDLRKRLAPGGSFVYE